MHRKVGEKDFYFVSNVQDKASSIPVTFRVKNKLIRKWNPYSGEITPLYNFSEVPGGIKVPLTLAPFESLFLEFAPGEPEAWVSRTGFDQILNVKTNEISALTQSNGTFNSVVEEGDQKKNVQAVVSGIPASLGISGTWKMELKGDGFSGFRKETDELFSWTDNPITRNFSGTGRYEINFQVPADYVKGDLQLLLDLGKVGNVAEVILNDQNLGTVWMRGQKLDVTKAINEGENKLVVLVTNTLINRISAMKEAPAVPAELVPRLGIGAVNTGIPREFGFKPLPASGLMGPVEIVPVKMVKVKF
jgi:hypothetical protein